MYPNIGFGVGTRAMTHFYAVMCYFALNSIQDLYCKHCSISDFCWYITSYMYICKQKHIVESVLYIFSRDYL